MISSASNAVAGIVVAVGRADCARQLWFNAGHEASADSNLNRKLTQAFDSEQGVVKRILEWLCW